MSDTVMKLKIQTQSDTRTFCKFSMNAILGTAVGCIVFDAELEVVYVSVCT